MKELVLTFEKERIKHFNETEVFIKQLTLENLQLRTIVGIGKEFNESVETRIK